VLEDRTLPSAYIVTTTSDTGPGSLRDAITQIDLDTTHALYASTTDTTKDAIAFNVATTDTGYQSGTHSFLIQPLSVLPTITNAVILDGTTQPGFAGSSMIELNGSSAGGGANGLTLTSGGSTIEELVINGFNGNGVLISGFGATGDVVAGNYIGTDVTGTAALPNGTGNGSNVNPAGVSVAAGANHNTIGGSTAGARNVISGNNGIGVFITGSGTDSNTVAGNYIGLDVTGNLGLGNGITSTGSARVGVGFGASDNVIGGTAAGTGNVVSGHYNGLGFIVAGSGNMIQGNLIGTNAAGTSEIGNVDGISLSGTRGTIIGGTVSGAGNIISGSVFDGIFAVGAIDGTLIQGNLIGLNAARTAALGNGQGIVLSPYPGNSVTIGGTSPAARNVISGNVSSGITVSDDNTPATGSVLIQGNYIGTDVTGTVAMGNGYGSVFGSGIILTANNTTVGGTVAGAGNLISGNAVNGVYIIGHTATSNVVEGNYIGTDVNGTSKLANGTGVLIQNGATNNTIGGTAAGASNLISGNSGHGVDIIGSATTGLGDPQDIPGSGTTGNFVEGNYIGTDVTGTAALANGGDGVDVTAGASGNTIGGTTAGNGNTIAFNIGDGVFVDSGAGNTIRGNSIHDNAGLGIRLNSANNANNNQAYPLLASAVVSTTGTTITGSLTSTPNATVTLDFYANVAPDPSGFGEGQTYLGTATAATDNNGKATFSIMLPVMATRGQFVTATVTDPAGNTSEFSNNALIPVQVATTTAVAASVNPSVLNQAVTFTASVTPAGGGGTPTGTVQFQIDGVSVGSPVTMTGGSAGFSIATLSVGTHTITAVYSGDGNFFASTGSLTETVYSAQQQDTQIINQVNNLVTTGVLNSGNGNALIVKLNSATSSLNAGNTTAGVNQLNAFINQVNAFQKSGKLTSAQAQSLIAAANLAINAANGTGARLLSDTGANAASSGDTQPVTDAGQLVSGTVGVCLDNADGTLVAADEQARFDDAISALDAAFGPYGVKLVDVGATDAADALVQVEMANTSAAGSAADGVLGCTVAGQITLVTGWNWYTGADASAIGVGQYDFETIVMHELGHAVGLGHSGDTGSVMFATLASATARRTVTAADLSVLEASSTTPEPLLAAPTLPPPSETSASVHQEAIGAATVHSPSPEVTFDVSLANALLSSRTTNTQPAEAIAQVSVPAVTVPLMTLPAATAIGPNAASESPRARDWFFAQRADNEEFNQMLDVKPVPPAENDAAMGGDVENAIPALPQDEPPVRDEEMLDRLYDEAGIDGHWTTAFTDSESALLTQPFVENATPDASVALAVALGGFWAAATTQTKRKRQMAFSPSRL
jgi:hypothetical protein